MWTALAARVLRLPDDGLRVVGSARDITAQRRANDELRQVNERLEERVAEVVAERQVFADMFESSDDPAAAVDAELRFIAMNTTYVREFRRLFGVCACGSATSWPTPSPTCRPPGTRPCRSGQER